MFCSVCGSRVPDGAAQCQTCGSRVAMPVQPSSFTHPAPLAAPTPALPGLHTGTCPRCGFQGLSESFFSRGWNVAVLAGLTIATGPIMGAGGIGYFLLRYQNRICPRCKADWGRNGLRSLALQGYPAARPLAAGVPAGGGAPVPSVRPDPLLAYARSGGRGRRALGIGAFLFAALMLVIGVAELEFAPVVIAAFFASGGWLSFRSGQNARAQRRAALLEALQHQVLALAGKHRGLLTVTQVATELGWPMHRAEKVLNSLDDGLRVNSEVTEEGVIVYEFREIKHPIDAALAAAPGAEAPRLPA